MERVEEHVASIAPLRDPLAEWLQTSQAIAKQRVNETSTVSERLLDHEAGFITLLYTLCSEQSWPKQSRFSKQKVVTLTLQWCPAARMASKATHRIATRLLSKLFFVP